MSLFLKLERFSVNKLFVLFIFTLTTSCAIVKQKNYEIINDFSSKDLINVKKVDVEIHYQTILKSIQGEKQSGKIIDVDSRFQKHGFFEDAFILPNFSICATGKCDENLKADKKIFINVLFEYDYGLMSLLSGMTLTIIPSKDTKSYTVTGVVLDSDNKVLKTYSLKDGVDTYYQLFLLFALPFQNFNSKEEVLKNLVNTVLYKAKADGLI